MRTEIERTDGSRVRFGDLDVRKVTRHDIEAFKAVHIVPRIETFADQARTVGEQAPARAETVAAVKTAIQ